LNIFAVRYKHEMPVSAAVGKIHPQTNGYYKKTFHRIHRRQQCQCEREIGKLHRLQ